MVDRPSLSSSMMSLGIRDLVPKLKNTNTPATIASSIKMHLGRDAYLDKNRNTQTHFKVSCLRWPRACVSLHLPSYCVGYSWITQGSH